MKSAESLVLVEDLWSAVSCMGVWCGSGMVMAVVVDGWVVF